MTVVPVTSGQPLFGARENAIYDVLEFLEPGLMLDIGATAGYTTKLMLCRSRQSRVIAFEPFPGNIPYFWKTIGDDQRVTLVQKAVSNSAGAARFYVPSSVKGTERGWADKIGYSSVGYLVADGDARASLHRGRDVPD